LTKKGGSEVLEGEGNSWTPEKKREKGHVFFPKYKGGGGRPESPHAPHVGGVCKSLRHRGRIGVHLTGRNEKKEGGRWIERRGGNAIRHFRQRRRGEKNLPTDFGVRKGEN